MYSTFISHRALIAKECIMNYVLIIFLVKNRVNDCVIAIFSFVA